MALGAQRTAILWMISRQALVIVGIGLALEFCVNTAAFGLSEVRVTYKQEGIRIDHWPLPRKVRALYLCEDGNCSEALQPTPPYEPKLFALVHELKHHFRHREVLGAGVIGCGDYDANEPIYPEAEFARDPQKLGITVRLASDIPEIKRNCKARVSYHFIRKRLERLGHVTVGPFDGLQFPEARGQNLRRAVLPAPAYQPLIHHKTDSEAQGLQLWVPGILSR